MEDFDGLILGAIEEALERMGRSVKHVTLYYAEAKFGLPREEIPKRLDRFEEVLREIYGEAADYIVDVVKQGIYQRLNLTPPCRPTSLREAVAEAKEQWAKQHGH